MSVVCWDKPENPVAPLSEKQLELIFLLSTLDHRPAIEEEVTETHVSSVDEAGSTPEVLHLNHASQFYSWLGSIEKELDAVEDQDTTDFLEYLAQKRRACSDMVEALTDTLNNLSTLREHHQHVSSKTNSLHEACEHLLKQQSELSDTVTQMEGVLAHFTNVDVVQAELCSKTLVVSRDKMKSILDRLDTSIDFMRKHTEFQASASYLTKAQDALSKALKLISQNVIRIVERTINELMELHDVVNPDNSFILLYGRFRSQGPKVHSIISLIEDRIHSNSQYSQTLQECHKFYLQRREELLYPVARSGITELVERYPNDHCALVRTGGAFMMHMCEDEIRLFEQFFNPRLSTSLNQMLSRLCRCLYDSFRPLTIHINHLEILSELCDILKYELTEEHVSNNELNMSAFIDVCSMLLSDVQERLIFRAHIYIKSQILEYEPSPGDLSYPEKLIMMHDIAKSTSTISSSNAGDPSEENSEPVDSHSLEKTRALNSASVKEATSDLPKSNWSVHPGPNMSFSPADLHGMWYPTVRRALLCLSKLSRCLDPGSFRGLAQECVSVCVQSLQKASEAICTRRTPADGQLFLIKHLLILREQIAPFNVDFSITETSLDFSNYKNAAMGIWDRKGSGLFSLNRSNLLLRFLLETPNVIEVELDSRRQLDGLLKQTCEKFISQTVARMSGDLPEFLERANAVLAAPGSRLPDQPFAHTLAVKELVSTTHRALCVTLGRTGQMRQFKENEPSSGMTLIQQLQTYLANLDTESILLRHIQNGVLKHWRSMHQLLSEQYSNEDRMIIACPTESQIRLLLQRP